MEEKEHTQSSLKANDESKPSLLSKNVANEELEVIEEDTTKYVDEMKKGSYNILVAVRCRPLSSKEVEFSEVEVVKVLDNKMIILMDPYEYNAPSDVFKGRSREQHYAFDYVFDQYSSQNSVFQNSTKFLLEGVVNGFNATVFAYGATGAGKTFTMLGTEENPGIIVHTLEELFKKISHNSEEKDFNVKLWYIEIYNENIRDLLPSSSSDDTIDLREDPVKGIIMSGINEMNVKSCKDIMYQLRRGNKLRTTESTNANETSSRSHAILQVIVEHKDKTTGTEAEIRIGKLSLIDLAGSERASATLNRGIRLIEGANINRSLLTLGNCITALCEATEKGNNKAYIPYRDSKLTRLLKDSLGGNARTVMIANISPAASVFEDTYNTLKYANRAKKIKTNISRNVLNVQYHISKYNNIINSLKSEITDLKQQLLRRDKSTESTATIVTKTTNNNPGNAHFSKLFDSLVSELKSACEEELSTKTRLYDLEQTLHNIKLTTTHQILDDILDESDPHSIKGMTKKIEITKEKLKSFAKKRDSIVAQWNKANTNSNSSKDIYTNYLNILIKEHKSKLKEIESKIKESYNTEVVNNKDHYIQDLENQIKIRDQILNKNKTLQNTIENVKTVDEIKKDYNKLPMIYVKDKTEETASLVYVNRLLVLPPVNLVSNAIDTSVNHGNGSNGLHLQKIKKPAKVVSNNVGFNYQKIGDRDNLSVFHSANIRNGSQNQVKRAGSNGRNLNVLNRNKSAYKKYNKDSTNDRSPNNSNSVDYSHFDIEHSISVDDRRANNLKPYFKKPESSPKNKGGENSFMKYDERGTPALKKKDLNVYLNDRQKYKNIKKNPIR